MTTATSAGLAVSAIADLLIASGYRVTITIDDAVVGERPLLGVRHVLRRVVGQRNADGSFRLGYLIARPGQPGGPIYAHELVAQEPRCADLAQLIDWLAVQDGRAFPSKAGVA